MTPESRRAELARLSAEYIALGGTSAPTALTTIAAQFVAQDDADIAGVEAPRSRKSPGANRGEVVCEWKNDRR